MTTHPQATEYRTPFCIFPLSLAHAPALGPGSTLDLPPLRIALAPRQGSQAGSTRQDSDRADSVTHAARTRTGPPHPNRAPLTAIIGHELPQLRSH